MVDVDDSSMQVKSPPKCGLVWWSTDAWCCFYEPSLLWSIETGDPSVPKCRIYSNVLIVVCWFVCEVKADKKAQKEKHDKEEQLRLVSLSVCLTSNVYDWQQLRAILDFSSWH